MAKILAPLLGMLAIASILGSATPAAAAECVNVNTAKITGTEVTTSPGLGCPGARRVMKSYFRLVVDTGQTVGGCAQVRASKGCQIGEFRCYTRYKYSTNTLRGVCKGRPGRVRFREFDRGPA